MPVLLADTPAVRRAANWKWLVCGLLLLATMLNYMDRLTINLTAVEIKKEMNLSNEQYGQIEWIFGIGFAFGALIMGWSADRWTVRWLYPAAVLAWSAAGFATGFAADAHLAHALSLLAGHLRGRQLAVRIRTTQHILPPSQRTMGNSLAAERRRCRRRAHAAGHQPVHGRTQPPRLALSLFRDRPTGDVLGRPLAVLRPPRRPAGTEEPPPFAKGAESESLLDIIFQRRFLVLLIVVICINLTWHFFRVWLPLYLRESLWYRKQAVNHFTSAYYIATDVGALMAGFMTLYFVRRGATVHVSRTLVFLGGTLLTLLCLAIPVFSERIREQPFDILGSPEGPVFVREVAGPGWILMGLLLFIGAGSLVLFPVYYSLSQELTVRNQGKVTGTLGFATWTATALMHPIVGRYLDSSKALTGTADYQNGIVVAGLIPLIGLGALVLLWGKDVRRDPEPSERSSSKSIQERPRRA